VPAVSAGGPVAIRNLFAHKLKGTAAGQGAWDHDGSLRSADEVCTSASRTNITFASLIGFPRMHLIEEAANPDGLIFLLFLVL